MNRRDAERKEKKGKCKIKINITTILSGNKLI